MKPAETKRPSRLVALVLGAGLAGVVGGGLAMWVVLGREPRGAEREGRPPAPVAELYQCPMHPAIIRDHPGTCPICGMKLVKVARASSDGGSTREVPTASGSSAEAEHGAGVSGLAPITIDEVHQTLIGLRTVVVVEAPLAEHWRTVGRVEVDPTRVRKTNVKVEGYVERVFVDFVGRPVQRGEPLFSIYSPALVSAQGEYLLARKTRAALPQTGALAGEGELLVSSAKKKLELWDVPAAELARLEARGEPSRTITFVSPISGVVTQKNVVEGARLGPGDSPYEITDLSMIWVMADAYESDLHRVRVGTSATLTLPAYPGKTFHGEVAFVDPLLDPNTRTAKVHLHFPNPTSELKPQMFGEVELTGLTRVGVQAPVDAVIHSGTRNVVFVALGSGRFQPREVKLGVEGRDWVEVLEGLSAGDAVVSGANFLVDSESQLRSSLSALGGR